MKTVDFIKAVKEMGLSVYENSSNTVVVTDDSDRPVVWVETEGLYILNTNFTGFADLEETIRKKLYALAVEYSATPLAEREEKRYRLKSTHFDNTYLMIVDGVRHPYQNERYKGSICHKVFFTESELKNMDETGFIRIPIIRGGENDE